MSQPCTHSYLFGIKTANKYYELLNHHQNIGDNELSCTPLRQVFYDGFAQYMDFIDNLSEDGYSTLFTDIEAWDINVEAFAEWFCVNLNFVDGDLIEPNITEWAYHKKAVKLRLI